jgi:transcriptional regulator with XRE-family HTH domain
MIKDEKTNYAVFLHLLKEKRIKSGLTQKEIALRLKKPQSFISKYESGLRRIDVIEYMEICIALDVDPTQFMNEMKGLVDAAE